MESETIILKKSVNSKLQKSKKNYTIEIFRLISAALVVAIHTKPFFDINFHFGILFQVITNVAVPFFFCISGYFISMKLREKENYIKNYSIKILKLYVFWSIVYFAYDFFYERIYKKDYDFWYAIASYLRQSIFSGSHFHLWFLPSLICAVILLNYFIKRNVSLKMISIISIGLFILGLIGHPQEYYHLFINGYGQNIINIYNKIFITTRNGLFFAFPMVFLGYYLGINKEKYKSYKYKKILFNLLICLVLSCIEIYFSRYLGAENTRLEMNIFLPLSIYYLMILIIKDPLNKYHNKIVDLDLSLGIYVIHCIFIILVSIFMKKILGINHYSPTMSFILVLIFSMISTMLLKFLVKKKKFVIIKNFI